MKNKKEKTILRFFIGALIFTTGFFILQKNCLAENSSTPNAGDVVINEIIWMGSSASTVDEWIELKNTTNEKIDLSGWIIENGGIGSKSIEIPNGYSIKSKGFFLITKNEWDKTSLAFPKKPENDEGITGISGMSLKDDGEELILKDADEKKVDIAWKNEKWPAGDKSIPKKSMERIDNNGVNSSSWQTCYEPMDKNPLSDYATPGKENSEKLKPKEYNSKIIINELLPNPLSNDEEFIELYNHEKEEVDLSDWIIRDASKTGKYTLPKDTKISAGGYLVIYKKDSGLALNDTGEETVTLYDPNEKIVNSISYSGTKENYSLNFDTVNWRWSKFLTPEEENQLEKILSGKIKMDEDIYTDIYADFEAETDKSAQKFTWNFGDSHKSYLQKTTHKYEKAGVYLASLKISGDGEDNQYNFTVSVKDYEAPEVKIIRFSPNPKGKDTENEWLEIKNSSKTKINLNGWSIATGWKTLSNHPIKKDFLIKPGKTKKLTRKFCAFTLNNSQAKIELRTPDGETAQKIKYNRKKDKIKEDEIFDAKNKSWEETGKTQSSGTQPNNEVNTSITTLTENPANTGVEETDFDISNEEIQANLGKYTLWSREQRFLFPTNFLHPENTTNFLAYADLPRTRSINQGIVLGIETARKDKLGRDRSRPVSAVTHEKHWAVKLTENIWTEINSNANKILNKIWQSP